jgi:hypothetical protein
MVGAPTCFHWKLNSESGQHFFSGDSLDLGFTVLEQHTIDLKDKDPVFSPQF